MVNRTIICLSVLVGIGPCLLAQAPTPLPATTALTAPPAAEPGSKIVPAGTRIPLILKHEISTRDVRPGDPIFLTSDFPIVEGGEVILPAGLSVKGIVDSVQRAGKVKGRAQLQMHFVALILPNNAVVSLPGALDRVPSSTGAKVKNAEGTIEQNGSKGKDSARVANDTLAGAGLGGLVGYGTGNVGTGAGIGAGAGAAVGLLTTLFTRGNDVVIPQGTSLIMTFTRPVVIQPSQLVGMPPSAGMSVPGVSTAQPTPAATPQVNH